MCQVNGGGSFSAHLALQNPWTDSPEIFKFDYVALRSDTQNMVAAENAVWGGHMSEVVPSRTFFSFFGYFNSSTAYIGFPLNAPKNVFWWWECSFGVKSLPSGQIFLFYPPQRTFFNGRYYFSRVSISNVPCA